VKRARAHVGTKLEIVILQRLNRSNCFKLFVGPPLNNVKKAYFRRSIRFVNERIVRQFNVEKSKGRIFERRVCSIKKKLFSTPV